MAEARSLLVRVFTHPACSGCGPAVQAAWKLREAHPEVELRTVSLAKKEGLDEAHAEHVRTIPTLILSRGAAEIRRFVGATSAEVLERTLREAEGRP